MLFTSLFYDFSLEKKIVTQKVNFTWDIDFERFDFNLYFFFSSTPRYFVSTQAQTLKTCLYFLQPMFRKLLLLSLLFCVISVGVSRVSISVRKRIRKIIKKETDDYVR